MAAIGRPFGKDRPATSSEAFISKALTGGAGKSQGIHEYPVGRPDQKINTAVPVDNVKLAMPIETSILDMSDWPGGVDNLKHSLTGTSAVNEEVGAAGPIVHHIIPNH
jgi:hypothetical protein